MSDSLGSADFLRHAGKIVSLVLDLASMIQADRRVDHKDVAAWGRIKPTLDAVFESLVEIHDSIQNPPTYTKTMAEWLGEVARTARIVREYEDANGGPEALFQDILDGFVSAAPTGVDIFQATQKVKADSFAFVGAHRSTAVPGEDSDAADASPLEEYYAEIRTIEDAWYAHQGGEGRIIGSSPWNHNRDKLRAIDERHGVQPDDARVYSLGAYLADERRTKADFETRCDENDWQNVAPGTPIFQEYWRAQLRCHAQLDDCTARHFGSLDEVANGLQLWAYISKVALPVLRGEQQRFGGTIKPPFREPEGNDRELVKVYSMMHELKMPWARRPPYPVLSLQETIDELTSIANRIERKDAERCESLRCFRISRPDDISEATNPSDPENVFGASAHAVDLHLTASGDVDEDCSSKNEWFDSDPPEGSTFRYGPLEGSLRQLASSMKIDQRTLKKHNGRTGWWIKKVHGRKFAVWFLSRSTFTESNRRRQGETSQERTK